MEETKVVVQDDEVKTQDTDSYMDEDLNTNDELDLDFLDDGKEE